MASRLFEAARTRRDCQADRRNVTTRGSCRHADGSFSRPSDVAQITRGGLISGSFRSFSNNARNADNRELRVIRAPAHDISIRMPSAVRLQLLAERPSNRGRLARG